jgi:polyphosphate kinase
MRVRMLPPTVAGAASTIGVANIFGLPDTHVLSSGVAASMEANGSCLQMAILLMVWVLALLTAIYLSASLFVVLSNLFRHHRQCGWALPCKQPRTGSGRPEPNSGLLLSAGHPDRQSGRILPHTAQPTGQQPEPTMTKTPPNGTTPIHDRIQAEMLDSFDEELELEIDDDRLDALTNEFSDHTAKETVDRRIYFKELFRLQGELVKLQSWVQQQKLKVVVIFEGRDSAGKGGVIKRITQRLNPRVCHVAALPAPSERERTQWYFQRYVSHLPAGGEIVLFDRSWYNRAGVERVMGFCTEAEVEEFFRSVPEFERMLVRSGIILIKYWFSITDEEQYLRFTMRISDPLKQWKLSPMDVESRSRWEQYTKAKEAMLERTHIPEAPWYLVEADDKKKARLNCIAHLLEQIPYQEIKSDPVVLPARVRNPEYSRGPIPPEMYVPERY